MSFKWKCSHCESDIVVPYKSAETISPYASAYCVDCFKKNIEVCEQTGEFYRIEDEDGKSINCYSDIDGIIFECSKITDK